MLHNQDSAGTRHNIMSNLKNEVSRIISRTVGVVIQLIIMAKVSSVSTNYSSMLTKRFATFNKF